MGSLLDRRNFIRGAGVAATATIASTPTMASDDVTRWRMQCYIPKSITESYNIIQSATDSIAQSTGGKFVCQLFQANEIVPVPGILNAVGSGSIESANTASLFYLGMNKAFAFATGIPFGMNARIQYAWLQLGGGNEILQKALYDQYNLVQVPAGTTGAQMGGWFNKEIKTVDDLKGLKMRIAGLGGEVLSRMGVIPQMIPPSDIYTSLEKGTMDAAEFAIPIGDEKTNLQRVAKYYYTLGFWDYTNQLSCFFNADAWKKLPEGHRQAMLSAAARMQAFGLAYADAENMPALQRIIGAGVQVRAMPPEIMRKGYEVTMDFYAEECARNPTFKTIYDHYMAFRDSAYRWYSLNETPMDIFVSNAITRARK
jgi:TRAP-type mannitol/chloroaromatic compound transport system substrate-binding protein